MIKLLTVDNNNFITSFLVLLTDFYLFVTLPVTVISAKQTFLKLKLMKNYFRSNTSQIRLSGIAMISVKQMCQKIKCIDVMLRFKKKKKIVLLL